MSCNKQEQRYNLEQTNGSHGCLITRRRSWQMNSGCETVCHTHTVKRLPSDWPDCHPARYEWIATHNGKSIPTLALPATTKAIAITIGGACLGGVGWRGSARSRSESPMHVYTTSLNRVAVSTLSDFSPRGSTSVSTPCVRVCGANCGSEFTLRRPDVLATHSSEITSTNPVVVGVIATSPVRVNRVLSKTADQVTSFVGKGISNKNNLPNALPPLPRFETNAPSGQRVVRISTSKGCGVVLKTSRAHELQSLFLRPSGSCGNLLSHTIKLNVRPSRCTSDATTHPLRTSYSLDRSESSICYRHQRNTTMPNAPLSGGLGSAKASCSPTSHDNHHQPRISACPEYSMSGNRTSHSGSPGNIFGISPIIVPSVGKQNSGAARNGLKLLRSPKKQVNQEQYFRVQLPCTRAASQSKDFVVTDSLKLYEDQIFNHCDPDQRPQSWCIDLGPEIEELTLADDSHSASPTSTVSSYSSSSSSDRSQNSSFYQEYRVRPHPENTTQAMPLSRIFHWPVKLGSPSSRCRKTVEEAVTPTSNSPKNVSTGFELATRAALPGSEISSQSPTEDPSSPLQQTVMKTVSEQGCFHCPIITSRVEPTIPTSSVECIGVLPITVSSVNTQQTPGTITKEDSLLRYSSHNSPQSVSCTGKSSEESRITLPSSTANHLSEGYQTNHQPLASTPFLSSSGLSATLNGSQNFSVSCTSESCSASPTSKNLSVLPFANATTENHQLLELDAPASLLEHTSDIRKLSFLHCPLAQSEDDSSLYDNNNQHFVKSPPPSLGTRSSSQFVISETSNSDVFTTTTPLPNEFRGTLDMDSASDLISAMVDDGTYAFSTLDSEYLAWMRLSVKNASSHLCSLTPEMFDQLPRTQVHHWVDIFNLNSLGLRLNFVDTSCRLAGTLRVYINLIKPVKMSLRQSMDILPQATTQNLDVHEASEGTQQALPPPARLVSFFLPRGTSKVVYITSATTAINAIQCLLDRFHIQESSRKFALYEHTLENDTIIARKLGATECPLLILLNWVRKSENLDDFLRTVLRKRIVLQENDGCDINWAEFTAAELSNFLRILDKEEVEYKNAILHQYGMLKAQVEKRMNELVNAKLQKSPMCSRVFVSDHPHAFDLADTKCSAIHSDQSVNLTAAEDHCNSHDA